MGYLATGCALLVCLLANISAEDQHAWSYTPYPLGPEKWKNNYETCGGKNQSPINIRKSVGISSMSPLDLSGYNRHLKDATIVNNGHTLVLTAKGSGATMSGGCLDSDVYQFEQLHFHWGSGGAKGSEHTWDGMRYEMEVHIVHSNKKYGSFNQATKFSDGLAVLGIFYDVYKMDNNKMASVAKTVASMKRVDIPQPVPSNSLTLQAFLPNDFSNFVCYRNGSLTTPGCEEIVTWTLFNDVSYLGDSQIKHFRDLKIADTSDQALSDNFRPIQATNGRIIYRYKNNGPATARSSLLILGCIIVTYFAIDNLH